MRTFVPRAAMAAALVTTIAGCAAAGGNGVTLDMDVGGRYLVMIPDFPGPSGAQVANELRGQIMTMETHVAIANGEIRKSMAQYELESLDEISARQLASVIGAQQVAWGQIEEAGCGFQADLKFVDTRSGDEIMIEDVCGPTPLDLAAGLFTELAQSIEGIRQAAFCNDNLASSNYDQALNNCNSALAIVPSSVSALYGKATALLNLERYAESLDVYTDLLAIDPTHQDALLGAGFAASRLERSSEAMVFYRRYLEINPGSVDVRMTVANDVAQTGDYVSAFRILELGMDDAADNADFQGYLFQMGAAAGRALREQGDTTQAVEVLSTTYRAYENAYGDAEEVELPVLQRVIEVLSAIDRTDEAVAIARDATRRFSNDPQLWSTYATALREAERTEEEIEALSRLGEIDPQHQTAFVRRAQAYNRLGRRQEAIADLVERVVPRDAQTAASVLYNMGAESIQQQNWEEAARILELAQRHSNGDIRSASTYLWGLALLQQAARITTRANESGNAAQFEQALQITRRSLELLRSSNHPNAPQYYDPAQQLIANQEAMLTSLRRGG